MDKHMKHSCQGKAARTGGKSASIPNKEKMRPYKSGGSVKSCNGNVMGGLAKKKQKGN